VSVRPAIESLIHQIYEAALDPSGWEPALRGVAGVIGADTIGVGFGVPDGDGGGIDLDADPGFTVALHEAMNEDHAAGSLFLRAALGVPYTFERQLGVASYRRSTFYNEPLRRYGYGPALACTVLREEDRHSGLGAFRARRRRDFDDEELSLVERLMPHLAQAVGIHAYIARLEDERRAAWRVVDDLVAGVILLDAQGRIVDANAAARRLLRSADGILEDRDGSLRAARPDLTRRLRKLVSQAAGIAVGSAEALGGALTLARPSGLRSLQLLVAPLSGAEGRRWLRARASVAVFVTDPERQLELPEPRVQRLLGLTRTEARVAIALAGGASPREIAERLGVQANTVHWHLKQIYAKTGTRRQAELVRLLLALPLALRGR
jgi:DNA-binding CsgD family transcriptional regulator/PAS domain-containing protein